MSSAKLQLTYQPSTLMSFSSLISSQFRENHENNTKINYVNRCVDDQFYKFIEDNIFHHLHKKHRKSHSKVPFLMVLSVDHGDSGCVFKKIILHYFFFFIV